MTALPLLPADPVHLTASPRVLSIYARGLTHSIGRAQGRLDDGASFVAATTRLSGITVARARVAAYRAITRISGPDDVLPPTMPEVLFHAPIGWLATARSFPLSSFGLIHVSQGITQLAPVPADTPLDLEARLAAARQTDKGIELDVHLELTPQGSHEVLWHAVTGLLSRSSDTQSPRTRTGSRPAPPERRGTQVDVAADTGVRYARVADDYNPHHLYRWTAKPLGYKLPIAHGMWTLGRVVSLVDPHVDLSRCELQVAWRKPVFMPGSFHVDVREQDGRWSLDAWDATTGTPHMTGWLRSGVED